MTTILIILNVILAAVTLIFIAKELLINFKESSNKIKTICMMLLTIVSLLLSFIGGVSAIYYSQNSDTLKNELLYADKYVVIGEPNKKEEIENQLANLKNQERGSAIYTLIGYLSFGGLLIINSNVKKELKRRKSEGKWDFKKL